MKKNSIKTIFIILAIISPYIASAQAPPTITVGGNIDKAVPIDPSNLYHISVKAIGHDSKEHEYSGVLLSDILIKAGVILEDLKKKEIVTRYLLVTAKDNYQTIYALPEIDPSFTSNTIILADKVDGKPLASEDGPFQIIVPGEKIHARCIRQVVSIDLKNAE